MVKPDIKPLDPAPDLLALHELAPDTFPFLLRSVSPGNSSVHYDILFAAPSATLSLRHVGGRLTLASSGDTPTVALDDNEDFLVGLDRWFSQEGGRSNQSHRLPFVGGWFVYLSYELAQQIEPSLQLPVADDQLVAAAVRIPAAIICEKSDDQAGQCFLVTEDSSLQQPLLDKLQQKRPNSPFLSPVTLSEDAPQQFLDAVIAAKHAIEAGEVYQANLSRAWQGRLPDAATSALFEALSRENPAPFAALARFDNLHIVSSSPERLVSVRGDRVDTRPIAGTRPRGVDDAEDQRLLNELLANQKEQAEHVMLIDLERNDLGRICEAGSVAVDEYMAIESYAHVHHIVSNVTGQLRTDVGPGETLRAVFPGGTITGCPKVRCMQLIADLEQSPRGAYTGSLGYLGRDGRMDFNILIRTMALAGNHLSFRAGAGIVADSEPTAELAETRAKARGLIRAIGATSCTS
ncbi:MAG: aminodeoxychorismate synthase component I [Pseudomonadota bacterium]